MTELHESNHPPESVEPDPAGDEVPPDRRRFLSTAAAGLGLTASYGVLAAMGVRFLYPSGEGNRGWVFVTDLASIEVGESKVFRTPSGESVVVVRKGSGETPEDFLALSNVCPHLGCKVHWEAQNDRFFCPCHNGVFDPDGVATEGPPAKAGQRLRQYPLQVEKGLLYMEVSFEQLASTESPPDPGGVA